MTRKPRRHEEQGVCATCKGCTDGRLCAPGRGKLRPYNGIRFTSDGFDCALPVAIDSHSVCSYGCLYCFADNLVEHRAASQRSIGQMSLGRLARMFAGAPSQEGDAFREALRYHKRNRAGYPCPIQVGAICDPADNIERQQGWLKGLVALAQEHGQPLRLSTKGTVLTEPDYLEVIDRRPEILWVAYSIISPDDERLALVDRRAPSATARYKAMRVLADHGVKVSLRLRPMMPGLSDATPKHPYAWRELVERAAEAGACAVSYEVVFVPGNMTKALRRRWDQMSMLTGVPFERLYQRFGARMPCMRPSALWTENIMHAIAEKAHDCGLAVGVSDPVWKQLNDYGCCCGISPEDPVFGNWEPENATNALLRGRATGELISFVDVCPPWATHTLSAGITAFGAGPLEKGKRHHEKWEDVLRRVWNDTDAARGPSRYFQGALRPVRRDDRGDLLYEYVGLRRRHPKHVPYWRIQETKHDKR